MKSHEVSKDYCKHKTLIKIIRHLKECCLDTSIHGPKYLIKNNGSLFIFTLWFCICVIGLVFCVILLWLQWISYQSQPTMTSIENTNVPIYNIRFPAITICNNNQVYLPMTKSITEKLLNKGFRNETIQEFFKHLSVLITYRTAGYNFTDISLALGKMGYDTSELMYELSQPCKSLIESCQWFNGDCKGRIKKIKTQNGFCCSLNYYLPELKTHLNQNITVPSHIYYVSGAGNKFTLDIIINVEPENYVSGIRPYYGVEILIHDGFAYPEVSINPTFAAVNTSVTALIGAHTINTDENVRSIPLNQRGCIFDGETKLASSYEYSYETCVSECRIKRIIEICNCVPYFYRYAGVARFCNYIDVPCLQRFQVLFYSTHNPNDDYHPESDSKTIDMDNGIDLEKCGCYPECNDITYEIQIQTFEFVANTSFFLPYRIKNKTLDLSNKIIILASYQHLTLIQYRRDVRVTWNNLLASLGGIFGLCVGGSVISIAEFFYLFALYFVKKKTTKQNEIKTIQSVTQFKVQPLPPRSQFKENELKKYRLPTNFRKNYFE